MKFIFFVYESEGYWDKGLMGHWQNFTENIIFKKTF